MGRSEKSGRRGQIFTGFKSIAEAIDAESRGNMDRLPTFAADLVKSDRLLDCISLSPDARVQAFCSAGEHPMEHFRDLLLRCSRTFELVGERRRFFRFGHCRPQWLHPGLLRVQQLVRLIASAAAVSRAASCRLLLLIVYGFSFDISSLAWRFGKPYGAQGDWHGRCWLFGQSCYGGCPSRRIPAAQSMEYFRCPSLLFSNLSPRHSAC